MVVDVLVVGAGIVGAAVAGALADRQRVVVVEAEGLPGYHSTGRSVAILDPAYGGPDVQALTRLGTPALLALDADASAPLLTDRGLLWIARADQEAQWMHRRAHLQNGGHRFSEGGSHEAERLVPALRRGYVARCLHQADAPEIDVARLHERMLRRVRALGGRIVLNAPVSRLERREGGWSVLAGGTEFRAACVVNAAGAWGDRIAALAGVSPLGLVPQRRTVCTIPHDGGSERWPFVVDVGEEFYVKQDAGCLLVSPMDATAVEPSDAWPDEIDVATAVERLESSCTVRVHRVSRSWAGLRTYLEDGSPAIGFAADAPGFFWCVGFGGFGIQCALGAADLAVATIRGDAPADPTVERLRASLRPDRRSLPN